MKKLKYNLTITMVIVFNVAFAQTTTRVSSFDKVIISPHIEVNFVEGNEESVTIARSNVSSDKINIEVNGKTLRVYLDGEKDIPKSKKTYENGYKQKASMYHGTEVTATVTYKKMSELSIRGEETQHCLSLLNGDKFKLKIYGESHVILTAVNLGELQATMYGESTLDIDSGWIDHQRYVAYGESKINSLPVNSNTTKITAYGESDFHVNTASEIKITSFGEAKLEYKGNAVVNKGLHFGEMLVARID